MDQTCINTIRTLAADVVQKANSGHPGGKTHNLSLVQHPWDAHQWPTLSFLPLSMRRLPLPPGSLGIALFSPMDMPAFCNIVFYISWDTT